MQSVFSCVFAGRSTNLHIVNVYLQNGNPVGTDEFAYKLAWMDRLMAQMKSWLKHDMPTIVGGDFNVIPEDIDCHKPSSWLHDALFQPEPRERTARYSISGTRMHSDRYIRMSRANSPSGTTSGSHLSIIEAFGSIIFCCRQRLLID